MLSNTPQQGLVHRHIPSLYSYVCAQLPELETLSQDDKNRLVKAIHPDRIRVFYKDKDLLTYSSSPTEIFEFKSADHYWFTNRKTPQKVPSLANFLENEDCSKSFVRHTDAPHNDALILASTWGLIDDVRKHLDAGADIHVKGDRALGFAAQNGHKDCVELLLDRGANIHADNDYALQRACYNGHEDIIKYLVNHGADIHAERESALQGACYNGNEEIVRYLLERGADKNQAAIDWALRGGNSKLVPLLMPESDHADYPKILNNTLIIASTYGQQHDEQLLPMVKSVVDQGADRHQWADEPFKTACARGLTDVARFLFERASEGREKIYFSHTLENAAEGNHTDTVRFLLEKFYQKERIQGNTASKDDLKNALTCVVKKACGKKLSDYKETIKLLIDAGADSREALQYANKYNDANSSKNNTLTNFLNNYSRRVAYQSYSN